MTKKSIYKEGFSLVEVILATSIFSLSVMGLVGGLIYGGQSTALSGHRLSATLLAKEGLEASENIASESFSNLGNGNFGLVIEGNSYAFSGSTDILDIYEREITISSIDANTKKVVSAVSWSQNIMDQGEVSLTTYITNWK